MPRILDEEKVGSFRIIEKIGEGGMAIIYKATQPSLKRTVVIKKLKDPNREIIERFKKEAFVSASFSQENVLAIYDFIYFGRSYYLVMEYVDGQDLRTLIDYCAPLPSNIAALLIHDVARGLEYTHSKNIIHRDIKPSNIIISYAGEVKLIDFGVAKDEAPSKLTLTGMIVGTPSYMSPEQANGDRVGLQSDIYSLGVLLYEMVTGMKPFTGDTNTEILMKIVKGKFPSPKKYNRDIPWKLVQIIKKAMRKDTKKRYANASEMIRDLNNFISWKDQSKKKEILGNYLQNFEQSGQESSTSQRDGIVQASQRRFWYAAAIFVIVFLFATFQINRFLKNERFVQMQLTTNVTACQVYIDGQYKGQMGSTSKTFANISPGIHRLKVEAKENGGVFRGNFIAYPGFKAACNAEIPSLNTVVKAKATSDPNGASVYINEKFYGTTPLRQLNFRSGQYKLRISKEGHHTYREIIEFDKNQHYNLHFTLLPLSN